ncbi:MAG: hypothetical protein GXO14_02240 [Thermococci archaeon]|nr:hypothetical protein [Thermococci archaeon]
MEVWYRSRAIYEAVMKLLNDSRYGEAVEMAEKIPDPRIKAKTLAKITIELAKKGRDYSDVLEKAIYTMVDLPRGESTKALMALAFDFLELGMYEEALKVADYIMDLPNKSKMQAEVALKMAEEGKVGEAMKIIDNILDDDVKTWAMSRIATKV